MDIRILIQIMEMTMVIFVLAVSILLLSHQVMRLRTWWRNRGWRHAMRERLDELRAEHDNMSEFLNMVELGMKGIGPLKGTLAGVRMADRDLCDFLVDFIGDGLMEIEEEERQLERAIREL